MWEITSDRHSLFHLLIGEKIFIKAPQELSKDTLCVVHADFELIFLQLSFSYMQI